MMRIRKQTEKGQALVVLLVFVVIAVVMTSAAVAVIGINSLSATRVELGLTAKELAESVAEDSLMRLLRDPNWAGGTFEFDGGTATVTVSGDTLKTVTAAATVRDAERRVEMEVDFSNNEMTVVSWKEI